MSHLLDYNWKPRPAFGRKLSRYSAEGLDIQEDSVSPLVLAHADHREPRRALKLLL
jgi:hypothetical protein